jgi:hypothetical protein
MSEKQTGNGLLGWIDARFPLTKMYEEHLGKYYAPKNFNFWYFFGSLALLVLVLQIVTGIFLTMHYKPDGDLAFASVEHIMRDVDWGWLIRYLPDLRFLPETARTDMDLRHVYLPRPDGRGLYGLPVALGADVLLGSPGYYLAVRRDPVCGGRTDPVDPRRLRDFRRNPEPVLCPARDRGAVGAANAGGDAYHRAA